MSNDPKKHHYVPCLLIRNWMDDNKKVWVCRKEEPDPGVRQAHYKNMFFENHLYTTRSSDGQSRDRSLEYKFADIERKVAPIVQEICKSARQEKMFQLSQEQRCIWNDFFAFQVRRTPDFINATGFYKEYEPKVNQLVEELSENISIEDKENLISSLTNKEDREFVRVKAQGAPGPRVGNALAQSGMIVGYIKKNNKSFVLGSNPIVNAGDCEFHVSRSPNLENWFPIAPDVAVCMILRDRRTGFILMEDKDDTAIRSINLKIFRNSSAIISKSELLLQSLRSAR